MTESISANRVYDPDEREQDDTLARAAQAGDRESRDALYFRCRHAIRRATEPARRLADQLEQSGSHIQPDDLEGEGFIIFCDLLERWQPGRAPFVPYMLAAMSRRAYHYVRDANHIRSPKRSVRLVPGPDASDESPAETMSEPDIAGSVASREAWDALAGTLSADWRRLVTMRYGHDLPAKRVALVVGCSEDSVNRTVGAALRTLRKKLAHEVEAR